AIAHVLRTVQRAKEATERVIAALRELKKSLMKHLFTYGPVPLKQADQVPLKETEIGPVPEHWQVVQLGEVADIKGGKRLPKGHKFSEKPTPYPYIRVVDFRNGTISKANLKFLTPEDYQLLKRYTISSKDVYISIAGTIGLVGVVPPDLDGANLTENAAKIVLNDKRLDQLFLVYALTSERGQEQIHQRATKTSQPKLALTRIRQIPVPFPPLSEQREIAHILQTVDRKIEAEEARKEALDALFRSLLHYLMTAKVRLPAEFIAQFEKELEETP
ncbi:MAG TPA: restriction endonuclease subunit S, partial [Desulfobacterales bacterium]|nr:restriction endonuclease subunit S [Desulfobacterales bacterium]